MIKCKFLKNFLGKIIKFKIKNQITIQKLKDFRGKIVEEV